MVLPQAEKDQLLLLLAEKDPEVYRKITLGERQVFHARRLIEILRDLPSDRTQIPALNYQIKTELATYKDIEKAFGKTYQYLEEWTTQWCTSRKSYEISMFDRRQRGPVSVRRDYYYCLTFSKEQLECRSAQIHDVSLDLLEERRKRFEPELESRRLAEIEYLKEMQS